MSQAKGKEAKQGSAFEYACLAALASQVGDDSTFKVLEDERYQRAKANFESMPEGQDDLASAAKIAIDHIVDLEPHLQISGNDLVLNARLQNDAAGEIGDVRDIIISSPKDGWQTGISCKHNHTAVKHSRLSGSSDFGKRWYGVPCSERYRAEVAPVFAMLSRMHNEKLMPADIKNKDQVVYKPLLTAFRHELLLQSKKNTTIVPQLFRYLLGSPDYYKVIMHHKKGTVDVVAFNIDATLGMPFDSQTSNIVLPRLVLPTKFESIEFAPLTKSKKMEDTLVVTCDNDWALTMRLHTADKPVRASIKFDIRIKQMPSCIYSKTLKWE